MRAILLTPLPKDTPWFYSLHLLALNSIERSRDFTEQDFAAICTCLRNCLPTTPANHPIAEFAAYLAADKWEILRDRAIRANKPLDPETIRVATEVFFYQAQNWLRQGSLLNWNRVAPMPGIDLDYLAQLWADTPAHYATLMLGYAQVLSPVPPYLSEDQPKPAASYGFGDKTPDAKLYPKPTYHTLKNASALAGFLFTTRPPSADPEGSSPARTAWRNMLILCQQTDGIGQYLETRYLKKIPESLRTEIISLLPISDQTHNSAK